jgi:hypothetical protein
LQPGQFPRVELILRKLLHQALQKFSRVLAVARAQGRYRERHARVRFEVVSTGRGELQLFDAGPLVGLSSIEIEQPSDRSRVEAQDIVFDADREVRVVAGRIVSEQRLGHAARHVTIEVRVLYY